MGIGTIFEKESKIRQDLTLHNDCQVIQITRKGNLNVPQYFTHSSWINDKELVFFSDRINNIIELFKFNVESHEITQLTENKNVVPYSFGISSSRDFLIYFGGRGQEEIYKLYFSTLESEQILTRPFKYKGWQRGIPDICPDDDTFFTAINPPDGTGGGLFKGSLKNGTFEMVDNEILNSQNTVLYHNIVSPSNSNIIELDVIYLTGSMSKKRGEQRMWLYNWKENSLRKILKQKKGLFSKYQRVCHESFFPDGKHLSYIVRRNKLCMVSIDDEFGKENDRIIGIGPNFWHASVHPRGKIIASDTNWKDTGIWIVKIDKEEQINLCLTKSDWENPDPTYSQFGHPHPGWSVNGKYLHFTAYHNEEKSANIFIVKIPERILSD